MNMGAYYNENDEYAAQYLRNLIAAGHIAPGDVDERSIVDVRPDDLRGYTQCHFFAGIGGWSLAARIAGWADDRPIWTASLPCQPWSAAGKRKGADDERHLWPVFAALVRARRPTVLVGEQVASKDGLAWLDGVCADLEVADYAVWAADFCAASVGAPHIRQRLWWLADTNQQQLDGCRNSGAERWFEPSNSGGESGLANTDDERSQGHGQSERVGNKGGWEGAGRYGATYSMDARLEHPQSDGRQQWRPQSGQWGAEFRCGSDGKMRRIEPGIEPLAHGVSGRVGRLRAFGNAIVPQLAAEILAAYLEGMAA